MQQPRTLTVEEELARVHQFSIEGEHEKVAQLCKGVLLVDPGNHAATAALGTALFEMGKDGVYEALYWFWRDRKANRRNPFSLMNYGLCLSQLGHADEGIEDLQRAVALMEKNGNSPADKAIAYNNLGNTLERLHRHKEALAALEKGLSYDPDDAFAHYNRGIALMRLNRHREAIRALNTSLIFGAMGDTRANDADAYYNRAMGHFLLGDLKQGFADYEARLLTTENDKPNFGLDPTLKLQPGEAVTGKRILIHCEQGLGDVIQFMRFVPMLVERGASVLLMVHREMLPLFDGTLGEHIRVLEPGESIVGIYDRWDAIMSLARYFGVEREDQIPAPWAYQPPNDRVAVWEKALDDVKIGHPRVAVCWAGYFRHKNDAHRSIPLKTFAALFDAPVEIVSIQQIRQEDMEEFSVLQKQHAVKAIQLSDLRNAAAVLKNVDLVVTVDTSIAHLAGTMGIPTWVLIPAYSTDWRWQLERADSPWYPSVKLYRQPKVGDWDSVLRQVRADLTEFASVQKG